MSTFSLQQWLSEQAVPLFFIGFAILAGMALVYLSAESRRAALNRDRSGRTEENFAEQLSVYGFDTGITRATYRYLQDVQNVRFPIEPTDELDRDLGLNDDEIDQTLRDLLDQTGREYLPGLLTTPVVTVLDLVRGIQASPQREMPQHRRIA